MLEAAKTNAAMQAQMLQRQMEMDMGKMRAATGAVDTQSVDGCGAETSVVTMMCPAGNQVQARPRLAARKRGGFRVCGLPVSLGGGGW